MGDLLLIKFWQSRAPGKGSVAGQTILAPPYTTASAQCLRLLWALFSSEFLQLFMGNTIIIIRHIP